jgi:ubiquinone/menaquinone biosynthesis C-methylase UbiE
MNGASKPYRGLPMEGAVARWYAKNTARDERRFRNAAALVAARLPAGGRVLEVAPGPGYLAIELAQRGYLVSAVDISRSFVRMVEENARGAGVDVDVRHGNASQLPFADASFDFVVCMAAFKNFSDPRGAIDEMHRVLTPGGRASIFDLRKDATPDEIAAEVRQMRLSRIDALVTRLTFRFMLLPAAYTRRQLADMAAGSRFGASEVAVDGIGLELRLVKNGAAAGRQTPADLSAASTRDLRNGTRRRRTPVAS